MILALASFAAVLLSVLAAVLTGFGLLYALNIPAVVALPLYSLAYVGLWLIVPLCLAVNLICAAASHRDLPLHLAAAALAIALWLIWRGILPYRGGEAAMWYATVATSVAPVPVHWAVFLLAQRRRRAANAQLPQAAT